MKCVLVRSGPTELQQYQDKADAPGKHLRTRSRVRKVVARCKRKKKLKKIHTWDKESRE